MNELVQTLVDPDNIRAIVSASALVLAFALAGRLLLYFFDTTIRRLTRRTDSRLDDVVVAALRGPFQWAVTLLGVATAYQLYSNRLTADWDRFVFSSLFVAYTLIAYIAVYGLLRNLLDWYMAERAEKTQTALDDLLVPFFRRALLIIIGTVALITLLGHFQIDVTGFLATVGVGSLAIALAAQAALSDVISGFLILLDRRYRLGDRIELLEEGIIGDVTDIGLRTTRLKTQDNRVIIIPNSIVANNMVINHAYPDSTLRVDLPIGVAYGVDIRQVKAVLLGAIRNVEGVQRDRRPDIVLESFGDSAINLEMRCWIDAYADKPKMIDHINEAAYNALAEAGIEIPFPQRTLWLRVEEQAVPQLRALLRDGQAPPTP